MKKLIYLLAYCFFIVITACGGNKKAEEKSLLIMQDSVDARGLQRMYRRRMLISSLKVRIITLLYHALRMRICRW